MHSSGDSRGFTGPIRLRRADESGDQEGQKLPEVGMALAEVVAAGAQAGEAGVAERALERAAGQGVRRSSYRQFRVRAVRVASGAARDTFFQT